MPHILPPVIAPGFLQKQSINYYAAPAYTLQSNTIAP